MTHENSAWAMWTTYVLYHHSGSCASQRYESWQYISFVFILLYQVLEFFLLGPVGLMFRAISKKQKVWTLRLERGARSAYLLVLFCHETVTLRHRSHSCVNQQLLYSYYSLAYTWYNNSRTVRIASGLNSFSCLLQYVNK
ncbi:hypothetical protein BDR07DRAFT_403533 [Suillus spraguei]|nr:hypothetical protein BDR07DRAFT_403533 [Suillus spraguei]